MAETESPGKRTASYLPKEEKGLSLPPSRTVLLVIDPVNDFLSEGGAAWDLTKSTVRKHDVIGNLKKAIEGARANGIPVIFGPMAYTEEDYAVEALHKRSGINRIMFERKMFLAGSWGADFHPDLQPQNGDTVLLPHKGTDVFETDLPEHLQRLGTTHLVIAGMTANLCCESTGRRAAEAGYDVTFLWDAIGSENLPSYEATVNLNYPLIGNAVISVEEFIAAAGTADEANQVQPGDAVRGSDHLEIGKIERVEQTTAEAHGYMLVPRGMILKKDTFIPLDAVVKRVGTDVFINVPRLVVGEMPWDTPTPNPEQQAKYGPPANEVGKLYRSWAPSKQ